VNKRSGSSSFCGVSRFAFVLTLGALAGCHSSCAQQEEQEQVVVVDAAPVLGAARPPPRIRPHFRGPNVIRPPEPAASASSGTMDTD